MTEELKASPETLHLARMIQERMSEAAWEELHEWFWTDKIEAIDTANVDEIDITDLPNADDGHLIPFIEVFPAGLSLYFEFENGCWGADESYCVQPGCRCTEIVLAFLLFRDATGKRTTVLENTPAIRYDYRKQTTRALAPGPAGTPPTHRLLAALKAVHPQLDKELELHHTIMKALYVRHALAESQLRQQKLETQLKNFAGRVGRNDPCPCGSGRKFKKCCGA